MSKTVLVCMLCLVPATAVAQSDAELIEEALVPLPAQLTGDAAVVTTDEHGQRRVIREGKTALTCTPDRPAPGF